MLAMIDEFTRKYLTIQVERSLKPGTFGKFSKFYTATSQIMRHSRELGRLRWLIICGIVPKNPDFTHMFHL
jgi:hypothetical protein